MRVPSCAILLAAAGVGFVLPSCDSHSSATVQNARIEEELRTLRNTMPKPGTSGEEIKGLKADLEEIRQAQQRMEKSIAVLKASADARDSSESTEKQSMRNLESRLAAIENRLARGVPVGSTGRTDSSGGNHPSGRPATGTGGGIDPNHPVFTIPWKAPDR